MKGFSYTSFTADGFRKGNQNNVIDTLKLQISNTWIALCVFEYQQSIDDTLIAPNTTGTNPLTHLPWSTTSTPDDISAAVGEAHRLGMKIMLKPHVDLYSGEWRAGIHPDDNGKWFRSYASMMMKYAQLCQQDGIDLLCLGTELVVATQSKYTPAWRTLIDSVRSKFTGKLVYASNWNGAPSLGVNGPEYEHIEFWSQLDYVGVDAYYPLTFSLNELTPSFMIAALRMVPYTQHLALFSAAVHKEVVFTEIGIQSVRGALASPWDYSLGAAPGATPDVSVQEFYYRVMIDALGKQTWCSGIFWWNWESIPSSQEATNYTPHNKPAALALQQWYGTMAP